MKQSLLLNNLGLGIDLWRDETIRRLHQDPGESWICRVLHLDLLEMSWVDFGKVLEAGWWKKPLRSSTVKYRSPRLIFDAVKAALDLKTLVHSGVDLRLQIPDVTTSRLWFSWSWIFRYMRRKISWYAWTRRIQIVLSKLWRLSTWVF